MKRLFIAIILILLAVLIGYLIDQDAGYVMLSYNGYTVETSLWVTVVAIIVFFCLLYFLIRLMKGTSNLGNSYKKWGNQRKADNARELTNQGLCDLAEGNWQAAQANLTKAAKHHPDPLINHLAAARAAHTAKDYNKRDEHLRLAHRSKKSAAIAIGLTQATLQIDGKQWEQALATLNHLKSIAPNHKHILKLLCDVHLELHDWAQLQQLLPSLKRAKIFDDTEFESIDRHIHLGLLHQACQSQNLEAMHQTWNALPKKWRQDPLMLTEYTSSLIAHNDAQRAVELLTKALKKNWNTHLVTNYGLAAADDIHKQITTAEHWLEQHPGEPELLLCIGRLYLKANLPGRAEDVLSNCIATADIPEAYKALAQAFEALGKTEQAMAMYKKALK